MRKKRSLRQKSKCRYLQDKDSKSNDYPDRRRRHRRTDRGSQPASDRHGIEVFETVATPPPLGVGINLLPHAVRELSELGLHDALAEIAMPTAELAYYSKRGQRIWSEAAGP